MTPNMHTLQIFTIHFQSQAKIDIKKMFNVRYTHTRMRSHIYVYILVFIRTHSTTLNQRTKQCDTVQHSVSITYIERIFDVDFCLRTTSFQSQQHQNLPYLKTILKMTLIHRMMKTIAHLTVSTENYSAFTIQLLTNLTPKRVKKHNRKSSQKPFFRVWI